MFLVIWFVKMLYHNSLGRFGLTDFDLNLGQKLKSNTFCNLKNVNLGLRNKEYTRSSSCD